MYPTYEIALQRQAETRAAAARRRMVREAHTTRRRVLPRITARRPMVFGARAV